MNAVEPAIEPHSTGNAWLVEAYWERAYRFAAMVARDDQESADIAQDALLRAWQRIGRFDADQGTFESWLWRVVLNVARDAGRASGRRMALLDRMRMLSDQTAARDAETLALKVISDQALLAAIRRLPRRWRTLVALRYGARLSYAEISRQLGLSEAAALMATRRALIALRASIASMEESR